MTKAILETKNLSMRRVTLDDAKALYESLNDENHLRYVPFKALKTVEEAQHFIQKKLLSKQDYPCVLAICHNKTNEVIGLIAFVDYNKRLNEAEVGYVIHKDFTNQGYMSEALSAFIDYGFRFLDLKRIYGKSHPLNLASQKVMINAGMDFSETESDYYGQIEHLVFSVEK